MQQRMSKVDILGVKVDDIDKASLERAIVRCIQEKRKEVFAYINIHGVNLARKNGAVKEFYNRCASVYCDGEGVRIGASILGARLPERTVLTRWMWDLCALCVSESFSVFFLGGDADTEASAVARVRQNFPDLKIAGSHHGYFEKEGTESENVVQRINASAPDVIFVALGMPTQELWIARNLERLNVHAILPAGSMMEYAAGQKGSPPTWMVAHGLEWLHRLMQEPARLWRRYLIGNPAFMLHIIIQRWKSGRQV